MSAVLEISDFQTMQFEEVPLQILFDKQKAYFATDVTKTFEWRVDQLDRLTCMLKDNYQRFADASSSKIPRCVGTQRNGVSRALRRHANHLSFQWTARVVVASRRRRSFRGQPLHIEALRSSASD